MKPVRTSEMQLWTTKEEDGQGLDQARPCRLTTVYRLVVGQASPRLTIEVDITGIRCQALSSGPKYQPSASGDLLKKVIKRPEKTVRNAR